VLNIIGPFWDGNEVWLLTAGGATLLPFRIESAQQRHYEQTPGQVTRLKTSRPSSFHTPQMPDVSEAFLLYTEDTR
jgi:hypothetical protein